MRLQALVRGHNVRKQAQTTMRCMQALVRVQGRVRARRLQLTHERTLEKQEQKDQQHPTLIMSPVTKLLDTGGWDNKRRQSSQKIKENDLRAAMKRERALAYAINCQVVHFFSL